MSKVGTMTSVRVWFMVMLPNNSFVMDLRYFPSYFGPVAEATKFLMDSRKRGLLNNTKLVSSVIFFFFDKSSVKVMRENGWAKHSIT